MNSLDDTSNVDEKCIGTVSPMGNNDTYSKSQDDVKDNSEMICGVCGEEAVDGDEEEGEARKIEGYRVCKKPSLEEVENHRRTHMPFQAWCPDCVMGRSLGPRHVQSAKRDDEVRVPTIAADYCFLGDEQEKDKLTILVMRDSKSGSTCSTVVENKGGSCEWAVRRSAGFVDGLGYNKLVFKSDNEHSVVDLWRAIKNKRTGETVPENAPKGESQANGIAERAIQDVEGLLRTLKVAVERRLGIRLKPSDAIMPWLVEHCGTLINRCRVGIDGLTAQERLKNKPNKKKMCEVAESVLYMPVMPKSDKGKDKLNPKFERGIWLGVHARSNEDIVGTPEGVLRASIVKRVPEDERWNKEAVLGIRGTPWKPKVQVEDEGEDASASAPDIREEVPAEEEEEADHRLKRFYIRKQDVLKYGQTSGCPGCTAIRNHQRAVSHNEKCRNHIRGCMEKAVEEETRLAADQRRIDDHLARRLEREAGKAAEQQKDAEDDDKRKRRKVEEVIINDSRAAARSNAEDEEDRSEKKRNRESGQEDSRQKRSRQDKWTDQDERAAAETPVDDDGDCILFAESPKKFRVNILDLTSQSEAAKMNEVGEDAWVRKRVKTIKKLKLDLVIGGGRMISMKGWQAIYAAQMGKNGYYVHNRSAQGNPRATDSIKAWVCPYYDAAANKRMSLETNSPVIGQAFAGNKIPDPCRLVRSKCKSQVMADRAAHKGDVMTMSADGRVWDDVKGGWLIESTVRKARADEMEYVRKRGVYERRPYAEAKARTGKSPIRLRWVDTNKGTESEPNYRSRIVAMEIKRDSRLDLFAPTPPLEAMKMIISNAASRGDNGRSRVLMTIDVKRAYFYAKSIRETYIELPKEDYEPGDEDKCGLLRLSLYGTRDAAMNWEAEVRSTLEAAGFTRGRASACVYLNKATTATAAIHGDDIIMEGEEGDLRECHRLIAKKYEITMTMIGNARHLEKELKILNRTVRWTPRGIEIEADKRHALEIIKEAKLSDEKTAIVPVAVDGKRKDEDTWMNKVKSLSPIDRKARGRMIAQDILKKKQDREDEEPMAPSEVTRYRGVAARINYVSQDRADLKIAALHVCKTMSSPKRGDWKAVEKIARYLKARPTMRCIYKWQKIDAAIWAFSDSDWAGDRVTRRSTTGGCLFRGWHAVKCWAKAQHVIALSSGEAELYACVKASSEAIGLQSLMRDMGLEVGISVYIDATATMGMVMKDGLSGVRHIDTQHLWVQEAVKAKRILVKKVDGTSNVADMFTKPLSAEMTEGYLKMLGYEAT